MIPSHVVRQTDFSAGQIAESAMRAGDTPLVRAACRSLKNFLLLSTGPCEARPGRRALFLQGGRTDQVRMGPTKIYKFSFGDSGSIIIRDADDVTVASDTGRSWSASTANQIVWARAGSQIIIMFPGMRPRVATWDGGDGWSFSDFAFGLSGQNVRLEPYVRFAAGGITMTVGALSGENVDVSFSADVMVAEHVGVRFRYAERQLEITSVTDARNGKATITQNLPPIISYTGANTDGFNIDDAVEGSSSGAKGIVIGISAGQLDILMTKNYLGFDPSPSDGVPSEKIVGPSGSTEFTGQSAGVAGTIKYWDEAVASNARGWPQSVFSDRDRLGFCDFPSVPNGIAWSAIEVFDDFLVGADPESAMFERMNSPDRVYHVMGGADEFVFTDTGVKYIPISETNPLKPGSVAFREIPSAPASSVRPISNADGLIYIDAGRGRIVGIVGTGQVSQPYITRDVSEYSAALFNSPITIAVTTGDSTIPGRYIYVVNEDGTMAVGRYDAEKEWVGWLPWTGSGDVKWASGLDNNLILTVRYTPTSTTERFMVERQDATCYLDALIPVNDIPTQLAPAAGQGPLWWRAGGAVDVMDGLRYLGTRQIDANGNFIVEEGEDLSGSGIVAGLNAVATLVPFIRHAAEGQSVKQSQRRRKIKRIAVTVQNSLGFLLDNRRVPPWVQGEDQAGQPPLRERTYFFRKSGRAVDPTVTLVKDVPGPLRIVELSYEVTV